MTANTMFYRMFNLLALAALVVMAVLTVQQAAGAGQVARAAAGLSANPEAGPAECLVQPARQAVSASYVEDLNMWVAHTAGGPTGVDGGLIHVLSLPRCK